jgi:acyl-CoA thioester hydrolase
VRETAYLSGMAAMHETPLAVRDYECDMQGVVNNAVYLHYLEHARHLWLLSTGLDFSALHDQGVDLVVARIEVDYRFPLRSGDRFAVRSLVQREGRLKAIFRQEIFRLPDEKLIVQARVTAACLQGGRPAFPAFLAEAFEKAGVQGKPPAAGSTATGS